LNGIDISSRYFYSVALKNKKDKEVLQGFKNFYNKSKIKAIRSDNGSEFINNKFVEFIDKNNIKQVLSELGKPQSNKTIKRAKASNKNKRTGEISTRFHII